MKTKIFNSLLFTLMLMAASFTTAFAQRDGRSRGGFQERSSRGLSPTEQRAPATIQRPQRAGAQTLPNTEATSIERSNSDNSFNRNNPPTRSSRQPFQSRPERPAVPDRSDRDNSFNRGNTSNSNSWYRADRANSNRSYGSSYSNRGYNNSTYSNRGYSRYNNGRYRYVPQRHIYFGAPRYSVIPRGSISIQFGGYPYYYNSGLFYNYYNGFYQPIFPPVGIRIGMLPFGYMPLYIGANRYYYSSGIYYRQYDDRNYEVVDAPMGAQVSSLPKGAKSVYVNGEKFYELNGTYYNEDRDSKGKKIYTVVGKNGEIDNTEDDEPQPSTQSYSIGDVLSKLPEGSQPVTINGEQLFVAPDNSYLKPQGNNDNVEYKVVGKAEEGSSNIENN